MDPGEWCNCRQFFSVVSCHLQGHSSSANSACLQTIAWVSASHRPACCYVTVANEPPGEAAIMKPVVRIASASNRPVENQACFLSRDNVIVQVGVGVWVVTNGQNNGFSKKPTSPLYESFCLPEGKVGYKMGAARRYNSGYFNTL